MKTYAFKHKGMVKMPNGTVRHPTKWMVKQLSGQMAGAYALFDTIGQAKEEACYMADFNDVCTAIYAPIHENEV